MSRRPPQLVSGQSLGPYAILRHIGRGGMGEVYEALDERLQRKTVIKTILSGADASESNVAKFLNEARTLAQVSHANVVTIYSVDRLEGVDFIAMELVPGPDLKSVFQNFMFSAAEALPLILQALEGLEALHQRGILHRDLKPANIILSPDGQIKLLDFGIAKFIDAQAMDQTATHVFKGTPLYSAPEIYRGERATRSSDLWSVGAILFEAIAGQKLSQPPTSANFAQALHHLSEINFELRIQAIPALPKATRQILEKLCARSPQERFASATEAIVATRAAMAEHGPIPSRFYRAVTRALNNADETRRRIRERGYSDLETKRIMTLAALTEVEIQMDETMVSELTGDPGALSISDVAVERGLKRFGADPNRAEQTKTVKSARQFASSMRFAMLTAGLLLIGLAAFPAHSPGPELTGSASDLNRVPAAQAGSLASSRLRVGSYKYSYDYLLCQEVLQACREGGYLKGGAPQGKGIYVNCLTPLVEGKEVAHVLVHPFNAQVTRCAVTQRRR